MPESQDQLRCETCPMRVVPEGRIARLLFGITQGIRLPKPPSPDALDGCSGSPNLAVGEVVGTDTLGFSFYGQSVSGTCIAEGVHVEANSAKAHNRLSIVKVTNK